jgi:hypothetical protein
VQQKNRAQHLKTAPHEFIVPQLSGSSANNHAEKWDECDTLNNSVSILQHSAPNSHVKKHLHRFNYEFFVCAHGLAQWDGRTPRSMGLKSNAKHVHHNQQGAEHDRFRFTSTHAADKVVLTLLFVAHPC